jgi:hypothetical protein
MSWRGPGSYRRPGSEGIAVIRQLTDWLEALEQSLFENYPEVRQDVEKRLLKGRPASALKMQKVHRLHEEIEAVILRIDDNGGLPWTVRSRSRQSALSWLRRPSGGVPCQEPGSISRGGWNLGRDTAGVRFWSVGIASRMSRCRAVFCFPSRTGDHQEGPSGERSKESQRE